VSWNVRIGIAILRGYQLLISPFTGGACRFEPSCSAYGIEAVEVHGLRRGLWLALVRVSRCHPLGSAGLDPVPPRTPGR
jgi:uncharacterized protein